MSARAYISLRSSAGRLSKLQRLLLLLWLSETSEVRTETLVLSACFSRSMNVFVAYQQVRMIRAWWTCGLLECARW